MKSNRRFSSRLLICTLLAMLGAIVTMIAGVAWYQLQTSRAAQSTYLLSLAYAGAQELSQTLRAAGHTQLPNQLSPELQKKVAATMEALEGPLVLSSLGAVTEVLSNPGKGHAKGAHVAYFGVHNLSPTESPPAAAAPSPEMMEISSGDAAYKITTRTEATQPNGKQIRSWAAVFVPVTGLNSSDVIGFLCVKQPKIELRHILPAKRFLSIITAAGLVGLLPGLALFYLIGLRTHQRTLQLTNGLAHLREGRWDHRIDESGRDDLAKASRVLNQTMEYLQHEEERKRYILDGLMSARKQAEAGMEAKSDFLANMSHEIRTPMNGIIGTTSLLQNTKLDFEQQELVGMIHTSGESLLHLINDILDFTKLESDKMVMEQAPVCLETLMKETVTMLAYKCADKGIELNYHINEMLPGRIVGDFYRLKQILVNLLGNAAKFTEGGEILVVVNALPKTQANGSEVVYLHFSVRDTGIGIAEDKIPHLFQVFTQADTSTTRQYGGTGLGLAICRKLCHLMGGEINVKSRPGLGSEFYFEVPLRAAPDNPDIINVANHSLQDKHVLIISANECTGRLLYHYCKDQRLQPTLLMAQDGHAVLPPTSPSMIVLDGGGLPLKTISSITETAVQTGRAIVGLAPLGDEQLKKYWQATINGPASSVISKPVHRKDLVKALHQAVTSKSAPERVTPGKKAASTSFAEQHPARILLVEDQPMNQKLAMMMLSKLGYNEVKLAHNGREAADMALAESFDLIFMDLQMPVMGGMDATNEIRKDYRIPRQPYIIAMTGHALSGVKESCMEVGMDDFLTKPVSLEDLRGSIARIPRPNSQVAMLA